MDCLEGVYSNSEGRWTLSFINYLAETWVASSSLIFIFILSILAGAYRFKLCFNLKAILILIFLVQASVFWRYTIDDAYISLRYAKNIADGFGFRYDRTLEVKPLEGYTNFLLVLFEAFLFKLTLTVESILIILKVCGIISCILIAEISARISKALYGTGAEGVVFALICAYPPLAFWAVGGLETTFFSLFIVLFVYSLSWRTKAKYFYSAIFIITASLLRPEAMFAGIGICCASVLIDLRMKQLKLNVKNFSIFIVLICWTLISIWRVYYFDYPLPNTYYAKKADLFSTDFLSRINELVPFVFGILPLFLIIKKDRKDQHLINSNEVFFVTAGLLLFFGGLCLEIKREWMPGFRYELPMIPLILILISRFWYQYTDENRLIASLGAVLITLLVATSFPSLRGQLIYSAHLYNSHVALGKWIKQQMPNVKTIAGWDAGAIPLFSEVERYVEIHPEGILSPITPHYGYQVEEILSTAPEIILLPLGVENSTDGMSEVLLFAQKNNYIKLFNVYHTCNYVIQVFYRDRLKIDQTLVDSGRVLENLSAETNCPILYKK